MKRALPALAAVLFSCPLVAQQGPGVAPTPAAAPTSAPTTREMRSVMVGGQAVKPAISNPYDGSADAKKVVAAAVEKAKAEKKRVLVTLGANWCSWCRSLDHLLTNDPKVSAALGKSYVKVNVDVGRMKRNLDLAATWGADPKKGIPLLVVLDGTGKALKVQDTAVLELEKGHDPAKVLAFLEENAPR